MLKILGMDCGSVLLIWTVYLQSTTVTWICTADLHCDIMWHILSMCKLFCFSFVMFNALRLSFYILFYMPVLSMCIVLYQDVLLIWTVEL